MTFINSRKFFLFNDLGSLKYLAKSSRINLDKPFPQFLRLDKIFLTSNSFDKPQYFSIAAVLSPRERKVRTACSSGNPVITLWEGNMFFIFAACFKAFFRSWLAWTCFFRVACSSLCNNFRAFSAAAQICSGIFLVAAAPVSAGMH